MQTISQTQNNVTTAFHPGTKEAIRNELNQIALRVWHKLNISNKVTRGITAVQAQKGNRAPGEQFGASITAIGACLSPKATKESQYKAASRTLTEIDKAQRECGVVFIERIPGTPDTSPVFYDYFGPLLEQADNKRKDDRRWYQKGNWKVTDEVADWVIGNLPKVEPEEASEPEKQTLSEYGYLQTRRQLAALERTMDRIRQDYYSEREAVRYGRQFILEAVKMVDSFEKTLRATGPMPFDVTETVHTLPPRVLEESTESDLGLETEAEPLFLDKSGEGRGPDILSEELVQTNDLVHGHPPVFTTSGAEPDTQNEPSWSEIEYHALDNLEQLSALTGKLDGLLLLDDRDKRMVGSYETPPPEKARETLLRMLKRSEARQLSLVARWWKQGQRPLILHLDDVDLETVRKLDGEKLSNLVIQTSPGSHHVWIRLSDDLTDAEFFDIRTRLFRKLNPTLDPHAANNPGSYGSARLGRNWKRGGCLIEVVSFDLERSVSVADLEAGGWLAPRPEPRKADSGPPRLPARVFKSGWEPNFEQCLKARAGDRFRAGFLYTQLGMTQAGWSAEEAAARLEAADPKGGRRRGYAADTVRKAATFLEQRSE